MGLVEAADEQEVGDLLDHLDRVRDPAGPEGIPYVVDFGSQFTCEHSTPTILQSFRVPLLGA